MSAKRPIAVSGMIATIRPARAARPRAAPSACAETNTTQGTRVARSDVTACVRSGVGLAPSPMSRETSPTSPG